MKTVIEMARQSGYGDHMSVLHVPALERFAALLREEATAETNRRANASWTLMCEKMVAMEREACAGLCDRFATRMMTAEECADAIRARGQA